VKNIGVSRGINSSFRGKHAILLYGNKLERDFVMTELINKGLEENQLCIDASVDAHDESHLANLRSKIKNYEKNINEKNLLIVNLKPFYDSALKEDLTLFEEFRTQIDLELERRANKRVIILADCADNLLRNHCFEQSELVERWWHRVYLEWTQNGKKQNHITIICPHLDSLLCNHPFDDKIFDNHNIAMNTAGHLIMASSTSLKRVVQHQEQIAAPAVSPMESQSHILVAEPEPDLRQIYDIWLRHMGFENILLTDSGRTCFDELPKIKNKSNVIIILDTHIKDIPTVELARQIGNSKPDARIIFTSTFPPEIITSMGINISEILVKPFRLSELSCLISSDARLIHDL
jgi:CheY-like chemotaxis protein